IGGAFLLLLGAIYRFYPVISSVVSVSDEIVMKQNHIEKYFRVVERQKQAVRENKYYKRQFKQMERKLLTGRTPTLAAVEIQEILKEIGDTSNVKFMTMRVMKPKASEDSGYMRLPVQFSINSDINQFKEIIYQIGASSKLLVITELDAKRTKSKKHQLIRSTITVEGSMKAPRKKG
ncbi:MAG: type 4a pilus biogenesis protein PilO, partial [Desulfobacterales bacterium]|nr:type 4a pilus biogenesis protein PilO [Desulfobacterales bacterium]